MTPFGVCAPGEKEAIFTIAVGSDDGSVSRQGSGDPPTGIIVKDNFGTDAYTERSLLGTLYDTTNSVFRWRTALLPTGELWPEDASIASAYFRIRIDGRSNTNGRNLILEWYVFGALGPEDWTNTPPIDEDPTFAAAIPMANIGAGYRLIPLANPSGVHLEGGTGLRTHISGPTPTGENFVRTSMSESGNRPQLILCWEGNGPLIKATPTDTPTPAPPRDRLPLGSLRVLTTPTPVDDQYDFGVSVSCPQLAQSIGATLRVGDPVTGSNRGTIVFAAGFDGQSFWQNYSSNASQILSDVRGAGFRTVQVKWNRNWFLAASGEVAGFNRLACRTATVARWIHDNLYQPDAQSALCVVGHSNGAAQMAYTLTDYGLADILSLALLESGPNWARVDKACLWDDLDSPALWFPSEGRRNADWGFGFPNNGSGPCAQQDAAFLHVFQEASVAFDASQYVYPDTMVSFVFGALDLSSTAAQGHVYYERLLSQGSPLVSMDLIPGAGHVTTSTPQGADTVRAILLDECIPH